MPLLAPCEGNPTDGGQPPCWQGAPGLAVRGGEHMKASPTESPGGPMLLLPSEEALAPSYHPPRPQGEKLGQLWSEAGVPWSQETQASGPGTSTSPFHSHSQQQPFIVTAKTILSFYICFFIKRSLQIAEALGPTKLGSVLSVLCTEERENEETQGWEFAAQN